MPYYHSNSHQFNRNSIFLFIEIFLVELDINLVKIINFDLI